ncbi:hypothetical protein FACS189464_3790 [Bacteroidia bacterium]|nr:hypothetical protein FACS189464_3790 [Bacteroidia bacterium]
MSEIVDKIDIVRLEEDTPVSSFDCGDIDLNDFLLNDAKNYSKFRYLTTKDADEDTRAMYFDLKAING